MGGGGEKIIICACPFVSLDSSSPFVTLLRVAICRLPPSLLGGGILFYSAQSRQYLPSFHCCHRRHEENKNNTASSRLNPVSYFAEIVRLILHRRVGKVALRWSRFFLFSLIFLWVVGNTVRQRHRIPSSSKATSTSLYGNLPRGRVITKPIGLPPDRGWFDIYLPTVLYSEDNWN